MSSVILVMSYAFDGLSRRLQTSTGLVFRSLFQTEGFQVVPRAGGGLFVSFHTQY